MSRKVKSAKWRPDKALRAGLRETRVDWEAMEDDSCFAWFHDQGAERCCALKHANLIARREVAGRLKKIFQDDAKFQKELLRVRRHFAEQVVRDSIGSDIKSL